MQPRMKKTHRRRPPKQEIRTPVPGQLPPPHRRDPPFNFKLCGIFFLILLFLSSFLFYYALKNKAPSVVSAHIHGDVYFSKKVFKVGYREMEEKFKVYVYDFGDRNKNPFMARYRDDQTKKPSEVYFFDNILQSSFRTSDPDSAHLFFLPFSAPTDSNNKPVQVEGNITTLSGYIKDKLSFYERYWNRTLGADHFILACHDFNMDDIKEVPFLIKNSILITCSSTLSSSSYKPYKDVSFPRVTRPSYSNGTNLKKISGTLEEKMRVFLGSKFRLCLRGEPVDSACAVESILSGTVPVIVSDYYNLPFGDILDWRKFSVIVKESQVEDLKSILQRITYPELLLLNRNLGKVQKHFQWNTKPVRYDAFHMVMYSLWLRRHVIRY